MIPDDTPLLIGALMFEGMDQIDLTGPFEALSRVPGSTYQIYAKTEVPVRDLNGLRLIPDAALAAAPRLDATFSPSARVLCSAVQQACLKDAARQRTGRRFTCCRFSARSP